MARKGLKRAALLAAAGLAGLAFAAPAVAQMSAISIAEDVHAGELEVPVNKSQVLRVDRPYAKALIGNPEIADVLPLTNQSLYVLGKKAGTTSLTLYDRANTLIAVVDVGVGPDVTTLKRQLSELMPSDQISARISNDAVVLEGIVASAPAADRAVQIMGALGISHDTPVAMILSELRPFRIYDGATELHRATLARRIFQHRMRP